MGQTSGKPTAVEVYPIKNGYLNSLNERRIEEMMELKKHEIDSVADVKRREIAAEIEKQRLEKEAEIERQRLEKKAEIEKHRTIRESLFKLFVLNFTINTYVSVCGYGALVLFFAICGNTLILTMGKILEDLFGLVSQTVQACLTFIGIGSNL